ncbi:mechanosensitive ion channel domain-containing protein [Ochrovirga pacifica]|uniref:mechanosensitive ion channel domain-containing protein n=1 Tax=Ochrovirga pacifica TaxID=1042376 RepID=UPI00025591A9|nr:mechanosensitive ion channel domain-containing protein [Ochrovirga pacifica]
MENIHFYRKEWLLSLLAFVLMWFVLLLLKGGLKKFSTAKSIDANRRKVIFILIYVVLYFLFGAVLAIIWGVDLNKVSVFVSSVLAVLGVGFFAQWSLLSNLTASAILFFSHPVRIGSRIRILDADPDLIGKVTDITSFYFFIKTDKGQTITFPNNLIVQKGIEILDDGIEEEV